MIPYLSLFVILSYLVNCDLINDGSKKMNEIEREIGSMLVKARFTSNKTAREIAAILKVTPTNIFHWENRGCLPPLYRASEIAQAYSLDERDFTQKLQRAWVRHKTLSGSRLVTKTKAKQLDSLFSGEIVPVHDSRILNKKLNKG